ncbi:MAG: ABC transporter ATP-binding protein [Bacilli bacterium]|nr:ABC transporter ATP-binding protein [Bacilli bacterium]
MPRPGGFNTTDKSKDFKGSMIRLYKSLENFKKLLIISIVLSLFSAVLATIAPNKLSDVTNVITEGIKPDVEMIQEVSKEIYGNAIRKYSMMKIEIYKDGGQDITSAFDDQAQIELVKEFNLMTDEEKRLMLEEIEINGTTISIDDQIKFINIVSSMNQDTVTDELLAKLDELPTSIKTLVEPKMNTKELMNRVILLSIIYIISGLFSYIQGVIMAFISNKYAKRLRTNISTKINRLPLRYFDSHETGDILSRVTNDVDTIGMNMSNSISTLVSSATLFLGSIVMMFVTNWIMAITAILSSLVGFMVSFVLLGKSQKYFVQRQQQLGKLNGHIEEIYSGHIVVKTYNGEAEALKEFDSINEELYTSNRMSQFLSGIMQPIMGFVGNFGYVAVCVVGAILVQNEMTSFGTIVAFMIYIRLFTNPLSQIAQAMTALQSTAAAAERVFEFQDEEELSSEENIKNELLVKNAKGNIEFKNVKFAYNEGKPIIKDFSAKVKAGQKIAIVGPTGAGKTTMVNLLMKFYEINSGDILIDNNSIKDLTRENIHNLFVMVLQDTWLFDGTVRDNIKFNKDNVSDEEIWKACKTVGIEHFIKTLPGGLDSTVSENEAISSGQKQLITIARGMIEDGPFLILDEATSNVDTRTEELVQKAMDKLMQGKTSFIIAHRLSTIKNADLILVMKDGNIVEQGGHDELMKKGGFYSELYNSQFEL